MSCKTDAQTAITLCRVAILTPLVFKTDFRMWRKRHFTQVCVFIKSLQLFQKCCSLFSAVCLNTYAQKPSLVIPSGSACTPIHHRWWMWAVSPKSVCCYCNCSGSRAGSWALKMKLSTYNNSVTGCTCHQLVASSKKDWFLLFRLFYFIF